jgi:hypothetical protein
VVGLAWIFEDRLTDGCGVTAAVCESCHSCALLRLGRACTREERAKMTPVQADVRKGKVLRSEAEVKIDEPTQTSAFQGTTKPTTH